MSYTKVSLGFETQRDHTLENIAQEVLTGMTGNARYPEPPVTLEKLTDDLEAFSAAMGTQWNGGPPATALKNEKRATVVIDLIKLGSYVQIAANGDHAALITSGFKAVGNQGHHPSTPLETPGGVLVSNGGNGRLVIKLRAVKRARGYTVRFKRADDPTESWEQRSFNSTKDMAVTGLTRGVTYTFEVRAMGGSTGFSDWSDPTSHMSM